MRGDGESSWETPFFGVESVAVWTIWQRLQASLAEKVRESPWLSPLSCEY